MALGEDLGVSAFVMITAAWRPVAVSGVGGLAWAAGLRGFMTQVTQEPSTVTWVGTFG